MPVRVFLDSNVFIYAFEFPGSNSALIIKMLNDGELDAVVSEMVVTEVMRYFKKYYTKDLVAMFRNYLLQSCEVIFESEVTSAMERLKGEIKDKDLQQLSVVKALGIKYLISYDDDFIDQEEYITPKDFLIRNGRRSKEIDF